jgi:hypothetical protein
VSYAYFRVFGLPTSSDEVDGNVSGASEPNAIVSASSEADGAESVLSEAEGTVWVYFKAEAMLLVIIFAEDRMSMCTNRITRPYQTFGCSWLYIIYHSFCLSYTSQFRHCYHFSKSSLRT